MLDFGSGPGTTIKAAVHVWSQKYQNNQPKKGINSEKSQVWKDPSQIVGFLNNTIAVEPSSSMISLAQEFILKEYENVKWKRFLVGVEDSQKFDLVT